MMKKVISIVILCVCLCLSVLCFSACTDDKEGPHELNAAEKLLVGKWEDTDSPGRGREYFSDGSVTYQNGTEGYFYLIEEGNDPERGGHYYKFTGDAYLFDSDPDSLYYLTNKKPSYKRVK